MSAQLTVTYYHIILGCSFLIAAIWVLIPDKFDDSKPMSFYRSNIFITSFCAIFLAEIGDKTQIATMLLAAKFHTILLVVTGSTLGMLLANIPAVLLGHTATQHMPIRIIRVISAIIFFILGMFELLHLIS